MVKAAGARRRANGEGSIYRTKNGRWRGAASWIDASGQRHRKYVTAKTQADVRRRLAQVQAELERGETSKRMTVGDFLALWVEAERQRVRPSTWRQREQYVRTYLRPHLGHLVISKLAPADVERMTSALVESGLSPRTAAHARVILRKALADALRDGIVYRNAAALARPPRVARAEPRHLDPADVPRLLEVCKTEPLGPLVSLALLTGMRQGELLGLPWTAVDLDTPALTVRQSMARAWDGSFELAEPKTSRSRRTLHLPAAAVGSLLQQKAQQDRERDAVGDDWQDIDGLVFTDSVGRPLKNWNVSSDFRALLKRHGFKRIPFHGLRHSAATALLASGVPLPVVSDLLGHAGIAITADTYASVVPSLRKDAADAMDRLANSSSERAGAA